MLLSIALQVEGQARDPQLKWESRNSTGGFVSQASLAAQRACHTAQTQSDTRNVLIVGDGPECGLTGSPATWELRNSAGAFVSSGSLDKSRPRGKTQY